MIKSDVPAAAASAAAIHQCYKDLAQVERAFRTFKSGHLEIRPTFVQTEASTRGHVFVVMLAYLLERELAHYWRHLDLTVSEALDELGSVRGIELAIANDRLGEPWISTPLGSYRRADWRCVHPGMSRMSAKGYLDYLPALRLRAAS